MLAETRWVIINLCSYIYKSYSRCMQISLLYSWNFVFYKSYGEIHFLCSSCSSIYHFSYISFARMFFMTFILKTSPVDKTAWSLTLTVSFFVRKQSYIFNLASKPQKLETFKVFSVLLYRLQLTRSEQPNFILTWDLETQNGIDCWLPPVGPIIELFLSSEHAQVGVSFICW